MCHWDFLSLYEPSSYLEISTNSKQMLLNAFCSIVPIYLTLILKNGWDMLLDQDRAVIYNAVLNMKKDKENVIMIAP